ncbi:MAG: uracil-DNA glycosylase, partial [Acidobacteriota bacterium]|nr:uracil-DNA glycosylase [Acidobacteriota bacterium]
MEDESQAREALKLLAEEVAEAAVYLRELGVEGLEGLTLPAAAEPPTRTREATTRTPAAVSSALKRNANAERYAPPTPPARSLPPPPPPKSNNASEPQQNRAGEPPSILNQTEMPKKPVRKASPDPPAPRETLFGDITPQDDLSLGRPGETFEDIRTDIGECIRCPLHVGRNKIVHTEGDQKSRLLFVGEAPGADEDASGRPFVGRAGQLLNKIIEAIGLK